MAVCAGMLCVCVCEREHATSAAVMFFVSLSAANHACIHQHEHAEQGEKNGV